MATLTYKGRAYQLAPLSVEDRDRINAGLAAEHVEADLEGMTEAQRFNLLGVAYKSIMQGIKPAKMRGLNAALTVIRGTREMIRLSLKAAQSDLSDQDAVEIINGIEPEQFIAAIGEVERATKAQIAREQQASLRLTQFLDSAKVFLGQSPPI